MNDRMSNEPVTALTLEHLHKLAAEAGLNFLIGLPHHWTFAFRAQAGSTSEGFEHWRLALPVRGGSPTGLSAIDA